MDFLIQLFLKAFAEHAAAVKRLVAAAVMGLLTLAATQFLGLTEAETAQWTVGVTLATGWLLDAIVAQIQARNAKRIQDAVNTVKTPFIPTLDVDSRAGPVTVDAIAKMASTINAAMEHMSFTQSSNVKLDVTSEPASKRAL